MPALPRSNIHLDILMGRDETLDVSEVFLGTYHFSKINDMLTASYRKGDGTASGYPCRHGTQATTVIVFHFVYVTFANFATR